MDIILVDDSLGMCVYGCMLHKLGIDNEFKISVYMGNENLFAVLWTLMGAKLLTRDDGTTSLIGFNFSNSVNNDTILASDVLRRAMRSRMWFASNTTLPRHGNRS